MSLHTRYAERADLNEALKLHRLPHDTPSQVADAFRSGFLYAERKQLEDKAKHEEAIKVLRLIHEKMNDYIHLANHVGINDADGFYLGHVVEVEELARQVLFAEGVTKSS